MLSSADLPNDIDALKALLLASERLVRERDATIAAQGDALLNMQAQLTTRAAEIEHLKLQIAKLRRMQFGRKSEKLDHQIEQLELQLEDLQADDAEAERDMPAAGSAPRRRAPLPCVMYGTAGSPPRFRHLCRRGEVFFRPNAGSTLKSSSL
jgi:chromosome segregation ATPase